ncbi:MAG TPA: conjugative transposon protein TraJ [Chryseosolibacter sp.]
MKVILKTAIMAGTGLLLPVISQAQVAGEIESFRMVLDNLYQEMIPISSQLIGVGRGLAGFASLWYIAARVWRHIANAESIDFYPLLRPFAIGMCILMFPSVLTIINSVLAPAVTGTAAMVQGSNSSVVYLLKMKEEAIRKSPLWQMYVGLDGEGDRARWYRYTHPEGEEGVLDGLGNDVRFAMAKASYNFRNSIKQWMSEILRILYQAAALCINTIRTFYLVILAILGPLIFGLSVFDGLHHTLTVWVARYINVFLWLPVANIFGSVIGKVQENMLKIDINQVNEFGDTFFSSTDSAYLIFLVIGIIGYFTVPGIANYIVHAGGANQLLYKSTNMFSKSISSASGSVFSAANSLGSRITSHDTPKNSVSRGEGDDYLRQKLAGK